LKRHITINVRSEPAKVIDSPVAMQKNTAFSKQFQTVLLSCISEAAKRQMKHSEAFQDL